MRLPATALALLLTALAPLAAVTVSGTHSGQEIHQATEVVRLENYTATSTAEIVVHSTSSVSLGNGVAIQAGARFTMRTASSLTPTATPQAVQAQSGVAKAITLTGTDPENQALSFAITRSPEHGTLAGTPPAVTYTSTVGYLGSDSFAFTVNDGTTSSFAADVAITVVDREVPLPVPGFGVGTGVASYFSPYCIAFRNELRPGAVINVTPSPVTDFKLGDAFYYGNIDLSPNAPVLISVAAPLTEGRLARVSDTVTWTPWEFAATGALTARVSDSILLRAPERVRVTGPSGTTNIILVGASDTYAFTAAGTYSIQQLPLLDPTPPAVAQPYGPMLTIEVVRDLLPNTAMVAMVAQTEPRRLPMEGTLPPGSVVQPTDVDRLTVSVTGNEIAFTPTEPGLVHVVQRLGEVGPVAAHREIESFELKLHPLVINGDFMGGSGHDPESQFLQGAMVIELSPRRTDVAVQLALAAIPQNGVARMGIMPVAGGHGPVPEQLSLDDDLSSLFSGWTSSITLSGGMFRMGEGVDAPASGFAPLLLQCHPSYDPTFDLKVSIGTVEVAEELGRPQPILEVVLMDGATRGSAPGTFETPLSGTPVPTFTATFPAPPTSFGWAVTPRAGSATVADVPWLGISKHLLRYGRVIRGTDLEDVQAWMSEVDAGNPNASDWESPATLTGVVDPELKLQWGRTTSLFDPDAQIPVDDSLIRVQGQSRDLIWRTFVGLLGASGAENRGSVTVWYRLACEVPGSGTLSLGRCRYDLPLPRSDAELAWVGEFYRGIVDGNGQVIRDGFGHAVVENIYRMPNYLTVSSEPGHLARAPFDPTLAPQGHANLRSLLADYRIPYRDDAFFVNTNISLNSQDDTPRSRFRFTDISPGEWDGQSLPLYLPRHDSYYYGAYNYDYINPDYFLVMPFTLQQAMRVTASVPAQRILPDQSKSAYINFFQVPANYAYYFGHSVGSVPINYGRLFPFDRQSPLAWTSLAADGTASVSLPGIGRYRFAFGVLPADTAALFFGGLASSVSSQPDWQLAYGEWMSNNWSQPLAEFTGDLDAIIVDVIGRDYRSSDAVGLGAETIFAMQGFAISGQGDMQPTLPMNMRVFGHNQGRSSYQLSREHEDAHVFMAASSAGPWVELFPSGGLTASIPVAVPAGSPPPFAPDHFVNSAGADPIDQNRWIVDYETSNLYRVDLRRPTEFRLTKGSGDTAPLALCCAGLRNGLGAPDDLDALAEVIPGKSQVNLASGNMYLTLPVQNFGSSLTGPDLAVSYNSQSVRDSGLGRGWTHTYELRLLTQATNASVSAVIDGTGRPHLYDTQGLPALDNPLAHSVVIKSPVPVGTETFPSGTAHEWRPGDGWRHFFDAQGRLLECRNAVGQKLRIGRNGDAALTVTDDAGRVLNIDVASPDFGTIQGGGSLNAGTGLDIQGQAGLRELRKFDRGLSGRWEFSYHPDGSVNTITAHGAGNQRDAQGNPTGTLTWTCAAYTPHHQIQRITKPLLAGQTTPAEWTFAYPATAAGGGQPVDYSGYPSVTDSEGGTTSYVVDNMTKAWVRCVPPEGAVITRSLHDGRRLLGSQIIGEGSQAILTQWAYTPQQVDAGAANLLTWYEPESVARGLADAPTEPITVTEFDYHPFGTDGKGTTIPGITALLREQRELDVVLAEGASPITTATLHAWTKQAQPESVIYPNGLQVVWTYTPQGYLSTVTEKNVLLRSSEAPQGATVTDVRKDLLWTWTGHNAYGEWTKVVSAGKGSSASTGTYPQEDSEVTTWAPLGVGLVLSEKNPAGYATVRTYDRYRNQISVDGPVAGTADLVTAIHDALGNTLRTEEPGSESGQRIVAETHYDPRLRPVRSTRTGTVPVVTTYERMPATKRWLITAAQDLGAGQQRTLGAQLIDDIGRTHEITTWRTLGDGAQAIPTTAAATAIVERIAYDAYMGWEISRTDGVGTVQSIAARHPLGQPTSVKIGTNVVWTGVLSPQGLLLREADGDGVSQRYGYDISGNRTSSTNGRGSTVSAAFNAKGWPLVQRVDGVVQGTTGYFADGSAAVQGGAYPLFASQAPDLTTGPNGRRIVSSVDGTGISETQQWNADARVASVAKVGEGTYAYEYGPNGAVSRLNRPRNLHPVALDYHNQHGGRRGVRIGPDAPTTGEPVLGSHQGVSSDGRLLASLGAGGELSKPVYAKDTFEVNQVQTNANAALNDPLDLATVSKVWQRDANGQLLKWEDAAGVVTAVVRDAQGRITESRRLVPSTAGGSAEQLVQMTYTTGGRPLTTTTTVNGQVTTTRTAYELGSSGLGLPSASYRTPVGGSEEQVSSTAYTSRGQPQLVTDHQSQSGAARTWHYYNPQGDPTWMIGPDGQATRYDYHPTGPQAGKLAKRAQVRVRMAADGTPIVVGGVPQLVSGQDKTLADITYDSLRRPEIVQYPDGTADHYDYSQYPVDGTISVTRKRGSNALRTTTTRSDGYGQAREIVIDQHGVAASGNYAALVDLTPLTITVSRHHQVDAASIDLGDGDAQISGVPGVRTTTVSETGAATMVTQYDRTSRPFSLQQGTAAAHLRTWNDQGQLLSDGNRTFSYDPATGAVIGCDISSALFDLDLGYDQRGNLFSQKMVVGGSHYSTREATYDSRNRVSAVKLTVATSTVVQNEAVTRDIGGRICAITGGTANKRFVYDEAGRLVAERLRPTDGSGKAVLRHYCHDWLGNRTFRRTLSAAVTDVDKAWLATTGTTGLGTLFQTGYAGWSQAGNVMTGVNAQGRLKLSASGKALGYQFLLECDPASNGTIGFAFDATTSARRWGVAVRDLGTGLGRVLELQDRSTTPVTVVQSRVITTSSTAYLTLEAIRRDDATLVAQVRQGERVLATATMPVTAFSHLANVYLFTTGTGRMNKLTYDHYATGTATDWSLDTCSYLSDAGVLSNRLATRRTQNGTTAPTNQEVYSYDHLDRLVKVESRKISDNAWVSTLVECAWDALDRLKTYKAGGVTETYAYQAGSRLRVSRDRPGTGLWKYVYAGDRLLRETQPGLAGEISYLYGLGSEAIGTINANVVNVHSFDALGNIANLVGDRGNSLGVGVIRRRHHDAYGTVFYERVVNSTGALISTSAASVPGYKGQTYDAQTGLVYLRNRFYDPKVGQFLNRDPAQAGGNWFAYCPGTDPVNHTDPSGLAAYFFDGTDNHQNTTNRDGSENFKTNVRMLFEAYRDGNRNRFYVPGIGSGYNADGSLTAGWLPNNWEWYQSATGTSMTARADYMMERLEEQLKAGDNVVDVMGFSRGAATATLFLNKIQEKKDAGDPLYANINVRNVVLFDQVPSDMSLSHQVTGRTLDTVGYIATDGLWVPDTYARNANDSEFLLPSGMKFHHPPLHLVALDEQRKEFAVSDLEGATQIGLRGVHSNVGGGYGGSIFETIAREVAIEYTERHGSRVFDRGLLNASIQTNLRTDAARAAHTDAMSLYDAKASKTGERMHGFLAHPSTYNYDQYGWARWLKPHYAPLLTAIPTDNSAAGFNDNERRHLPASLLLHPSVFWFDSDPKNGMR